MHVAARITLVATSTLLWLPGGLAGQSECHDARGLDTIMQDLVATLQVPGASLRVEQHGQLLFERVFGSYTIDTRVAIASASKNLSAAVLMSCVDSGDLRLDDPVSLYVPSFRRPDKAAITLRQCFSHSAGLPGSDPAISDNSITLEQAVDRIAGLTLVAPPGTAFLYGGVSMHVAGRACEVATGRPWATLFAERVATPLALSATDYYAFGPTLNPRIAGGVRSTLRDYARFIAMLQAGGVHGAVRVLSAASIAEMERNQVAGLRVISTPHPYGAPYGIGTWLDRLDAQGRPLLVSGEGAFGFSAWVDRERGLGVTLLVVDRYTRVWPFNDRLQAFCAGMFKPVGVVCVGASTPACGERIYLDGDRLPRSGSAEFALTVQGAPPSTVGAMALGASADPVGFPVLQVRLHLGLVPPPVPIPLATDAQGRATLPAPLLALFPDQHFAAQAVFLNTPACGGLDTLSASHAVDVTVLPP